MMVIITPYCIMVGDNCSMVDKELITTNHLKGDNMCCPDIYIEEEKEEAKKKEAK